MDFLSHLGVIFTCLLFVFYWYLLFKIIDKILEKPRHKKSYRLLACFINSAVTVALSILIDKAITPFIVMFLLMIIDFWLLYKSTFVQNIFCACACIIHVLAIRIMVTGAFSLFSGHSVYEISTITHLAILSVVISLILLYAAMAIVTRFIPFDRIRIINEHKEQQWFLVAWMIVNNIYLLYNVVSFNKPLLDLGLAGNQIIASVSIILGLYIVLFFAITTVSLLGYQGKNEELTQAVIYEQQYRNSIIKDAIISYEVNLTKNIFLRGFEKERSELLGIGNHYSDIMEYIAKTIIYHDDVKAFKEYMDVTYLLSEFEHGGSETVLEYRRLKESDKYIWVRAIANLIQDVNSSDLIAYVCVKDIDMEKQHQLELQEKAERDPLTGLYNKEVTGKRINEYLTLKSDKTESALFIIDVDNFKLINDHFGHVYGDAVLCELSDKLRNIFDNDDIVGRIGGDEFIGYIKGLEEINADKADKENRADGTNRVDIESIIKEKAEKICNAFCITYNGVQGDAYTISSSVGIAVFPHDGERFEELYKYADAALYKAKSGGKNRYQLYDGSEFSGYESQRTEILSDENLSEFAFQKNFRQNRIEYVFKILYQSENPVAAIHSTLELVANHFSFERGYIFETSKDGKTTSNTFEWCANGVTPQIGNLQNIKIETVATANKNFHETGIFVLKSLDELMPLERSILEPQGIKCMFQFGIFDKNHLLGFIGFDNCRSETLPCGKEIDEIATICNILATFFVKQHIDDVSAKDLQVRQDVMNHLNNYIYVVNPENFEVIFMNEQTRKLMKGMKANTPCYDFFRGKNQQCSDCPMLKLNDENTHRTTCEIFNEKLNIWLKTTASTLRWTDGSLACLINCEDVTKQKAERVLHIGELERLAFVDELTGSRTYYKFKADAKRILQEQQDIFHFIVKVDIDNFKLINQIYGYEKGNEVLCCVARAFEQTVRNENEIFARVANDEFVALFEFQERSVVFDLYDTFVRAFNSIMDSNFAFQCVFPHGIYLIKPEDISKLDIKDMFEKANIAHKAAKRDKSLKYVVYDESMTQKALRVKEIENKMTQALKNGEFEVYLQPKYCLDTEMVGGAEALTRWKNGDEELFYPNSFIPIFERNGFITKLDFYILKKSSELVKSWIDNGIEPVVISVNFSRLHLNNRNFVQEICDIVDSSCIERKYIEIEITETAIYDNIETLSFVLDDLHANGFAMSMDDFGSGCSSLGMLKDLAVDIIKMDRSFFVNQKDEERSKIVVGNVINMAQELGICIVAEGVEEQAHIDLLRELHCDMVQGYYYAKPMPTDKFTQLIKTPIKFKKN